MKKWNHQIGLWFPISYTVTIMCWNYFKYIANKCSEGHGDVHYTSLFVNLFYCCNIHKKLCNMNGFVHQNEKCVRYVMERGESRWVCTYVQKIGYVRCENVMRYELLMQMNLYEDHCAIKASLNATRFGRFLLYCGVQFQMTICSVPFWNNKEIFTFQSVISISDCVKVGEQMSALWGTISNCKCVHLICHMKFTSEVKARRLHSCA